jgi:hypothetical protein
MSARQEDAGAVTVPITLLLVGTHLASLVTHSNRTAIRP